MIKNLIFQFVLNVFFLKFIVINGKVDNINLSQECKYDILHFCDQIKHGTNFEVLLCLQRSDNVVESISERCHHYLWKFKKNYLNGHYFNSVSNNTCKAEMSKFTNCLGLENKDEVVCLIKHNSEIENKKCLRHVKDAMRIVFSDIFLVHKFLSHCIGVIEHLQCGRLEGRISSVNFKVVNITSQASTLNCLIKSLDRVQPLCKRQILRLGEIQSDDYHHDPALFYACREDRERLCANINSGNSQIYLCLEKFKNNDKMSHHCREEINKKQTLESYDFKIRKYFTVKCTKDIRKHKCISSVNNVDVPLLNIVLCLIQVDNNEATKNKLDPHCRAEVFAAREQLSKNIEMSIEVKKSCEKERNMYCSRIDDKTDDVIHCLLRNYNPSTEKSFSSICSSALRIHFKVINPTEDIARLDPIISKSCSNELKTTCSLSKMKKPDEIYECLLGKIYDESDTGPMHEECKNAMLTLAHFIERDYSLNHKLYKNCHEDAIKLCGAERNKERKKEKTLRKHAILHCLVQKWNSGLHNSLLSSKCDVEIQNIMKIEASNIKLNFPIYSTCFNDIIKFCKEKAPTLNCLQKNYKDLQIDCKNSITDFLSLDKEEYSIKELITRTCGPMVRLFCQDEIKLRERNFLNCLSRYKHHNNMERRCKLAIEHYQIISLDNYKINHRFARFCSTEIKQYCSSLLPYPESSKSEVETLLISTMRTEKSGIVACLSKKLTVDLLSNKNPFSSQCYEQFTYEFLQLGNLLSLDREIEKSCGLDINKYCSKNTSRSDKIFSCLEEYEESLSNQCYEVIARRQQLRALDNELDPELHRFCQEMINTYCAKQLKPNVFRCLHINMRRDGFNKECKSKILFRLERRLADVRLNPKLISTCKPEMINLCNSTDLDNQIIKFHSRQKMNIINCLRSKFVEHKELLRSDCRQLIFEIVMDAHANYRLDPSLYENCKLDVKQNCFKYLETNDMDTNGRVQDCLKHHLVSGKMINKQCSYEVQRLLREGKADIHVDIQLYNACSDEISRFCYIEQFGAGKKLNCLLVAFDDKRASLLLSERCKTILHERKQMWEFVGKIGAPRNVQQMLSLVSKSQPRFYLLMIFAILIMIILAIGIFFGRYTIKTGKQIRKRR